ncbi:HU family DNA-binding protein [Roseococcus sp. SDR]|uniref:HU family DNA-binding protein n=1 Tax=Roseococcus sp. SDR TaxID=2835532 RepID=UPI001BD0E70B|nr:HU family DNA-binding protein [Roseococcus sp. SDR]MBS7788966.1 HU family DNA-binding protein [Roseococcus sp. SDR]MBV1844280.1 HU family DNA-binding protein [Roseococcus sp. SDR]
MKIDDMLPAIAESTQVSRRDVKKVVSALFSSIKEAVEAGQKVNVPGLGAFQLKERAAGEKVNPKTGETKAVTAARFTVLKPSAKATGRPKKSKAAD